MLKNEDSQFKEENLSRPSIADDVTSYLREKIITGEFCPGQRIVVDRLSERLGVSQTPIREAFRTLEAENLLRFEKYKGAKVSSGVTIDELAEIYELRRFLEGFAAKRAASKYTEEDIKRIEKLLKDTQEASHSYPGGEYWKVHREFHRALLRPSFNPSLIEKIIELVWQSTERYRALYEAGIKNFDEVNKEHQELVRAARNGNGEELAELLQHHIKAIEEAVIEGYRKSTIKTKKAGS